MATRTTMAKNPWRWLPVAAVVVWALAAQGCGKRPPNQPADKAEAALEAFLDSWSRGAAPDKFAGPGHALQGTDPDWAAGHRLLSFLSVESQPAEGAPHRFRCRVALSLQDRMGKKVDKEVVYDVQLGEKSVISRASP
jgi:hypothetical protein